MGIGVETSRLGRRAAELATGAMCDDARQDEDHADDAQEMGGVLGAESVMPGVLAGRKVHDHVENTRDYHQLQPHATQRREGTYLKNELLALFYRQHVLVIHAERRIVKVYRE
jgi:hypothetical protein